MIYLLILLIYFSVFTTQNYFYCCWGRATDVKNELPKPIINYRSQQLSARVKDELSMSSTKNRGHQRLQRSRTSYQGQLGQTGLERATKVSNKLTRSTTNCRGLQLVTKFTRSHFMKYVFEKILFLSDNHHYYWCKLLFIHIVILFTLIKNNQIRNINNLCMFDINYNYFLCRQYFNKHYQ